MRRKKYNNLKGENTKMNINRIQNANFTNLLNQKQMGPNGRSKEWLRLAQSEDLMTVLEEKGSCEFIKELKNKLAKKGFYKKLTR